MPNEPATDGVPSGPVRIDTTPPWRQEYWTPGDVAWFEYHCNESADSDDAPAWYHSHQQVTVLSRDEPDSAAAKTAAERGEDGVPWAYRVRFADGLEWTALEDELLTGTEGFWRPAPPTLVRDEPVDMARFGELAGIRLQTLRTYRKDGRLPVPDGQFGAVAWWYTTTVQTWMSTRPGRWPKTHAN